ncbi:DUF3577 domain-containing protein [Billgrantia desiderata]|uniref:DUF3577 domain-containing protein n=1 Tax=Billgrantia desiderata TaxID=52021 RepID=UPI001F2CDC92|nr:DUF3577 domain-containing protein [Halomonas desiderata]MCE8014383.1 DUF3577 domain-containing protein [Halomonas desiderata]
MTTQNANTETQFFDLHTSGVGYLNRVRVVEKNARGERVKPYLACTISAMNGSRDELTGKIPYVFFDAIVSGAAAKELVLQYQEAANDRDTKVLIAFKMGDLRAETFVYKQGDRKGQTGVSLKTRLLFISLMKVNGETVFKAEPKEVAAPTAPQEQPVPQQAVSPAPQVPPQQPAPVAHAPAQQYAAPSYPQPVPMAAGGFDSPQFPQH